MRQLIRISGIFLIIMQIIVIGLQAQDRPKVGLVLSGGGAKGMAHIGVLKKLEELGIRPDYITGTSMGSIVGGLYAAGYSASEIEQIAKEMDWEAILSNKIPIERINIEEKPYYERYLVELGLNKFKLQLPKGLIEGQRLTETLSYLTRHVHDVEDFSELPIPFAAVACDISTGEPVVLDHGSLSLAMRASMAIPSVFTTIEIDDRLLVDGGLVRNLPVPEIQEMGADIIIGVLVADDLSDKDELRSAIDVLTQSAFVMSVFDVRVQKEKCDVLIEPYLKGYSTFSFEEANGIIRQGEIAADSAEAGLQRIVEQVGSRKNELVTRPILRDSFMISEVKVEYNDVLTDTFVKARLDIDPGEVVSIERIDERVDVLFGTRYFTKVWYELRHVDNGYELIIYVDEADTGNVNVALHYDTENQVGFNLAIIKRNLAPGLRLVAELDIAENPRADINILKYINEMQNWGIQTGILYRNSDIPIVDESSTLQGTYRNRYYNPYIGIFNTAKRNRLFGMAIQHEFSRMKPKVAGSELRVLERLKWSSWSVRAAFVLDNLNRRYFPTGGSKYSVEGKYSFSNDYEIVYTDTTGSYDLTFEPESFFSLKLHHMNRWKISPKLTLGLQDHIIFNFIQDNELGLPFFSDQAFAGGYRPLLHNGLPFWGAKQLEFNGDNMFYNEILLQYEVLKDLYFELASQYINFVYPMQWVYSDAENAQYFLPNDRDGLWSYGARLSYMSLLGPITVGIASRQETSDWNAFFSIGFYY